MLAKEEARATGSRKVEAEHILLTLARQEGTDAREILESAGLDHAAILDAIEREFEQSLLAVGVSLEVKNLMSETAATDFQPRFGQSAKLALQRAADLEAGRFAPPVEPIHLLLGVMYARAGTVPRILAISGVDTADLISQAEQALVEVRKSA
jgi:D-alanyl-D-alanine carboxypeptidase